MQLLSGSCVELSLLHNDETMSRVSKDVVEQYHGFLIYNLRRFLTVWPLGGGDLTYFNKWVELHISSQLLSIFDVT